MRPAPSFSWFPLSLYHEVDSLTSQARECDTGEVVKLFPPTAVSVSDHMSCYDLFTTALTIRPTSTPTPSFHHVIATSIMFLMVNRWTLDIR